MNSSDVIGFQGLSPGIVTIISATGSTSGSLSYTPAVNVEITLTMNTGSSGDTVKFNGVSVMTQPTSPTISQQIRLIVAKGQATTISLSTSSASTSLIVTARSVQ